MTSNLQAGVYRVDITGPLGISLCGYIARDGVARCIDRPLTATALVLTDGDRKVCIVACDLVFILSPEVDRIRQSIASELGTTVESVLINCSHTHCGPNIWDYSWDDAHQKRLQREYLANLANLLVGCASVANERARPARLGTGYGSAWIGINRREPGDDGKIMLGENPSGPMDPTVGVIRVDEMNGRPLAIVFSYGCHTVTMGPKFLGFSPDFPGPARELIERATGATTLFLQAAGGNINPVTGIGATEDDTGNMTRLGHTLGAEVLKVAHAIRTHQKRGDPVIFASLTRNKMYPLLPADPYEISLAAASETVQLPLVDPPSVEDARKILALREELLAKSRREGVPEPNQRFFIRFRDWAEYLLREVESGKRRLSVPVPVQALRIGSLGIAAAAGETLVELGLRAKERSPFAETLFLGYSNGCVNYIPPAECYPEGGWSPWETYYVPDMLCQSYMLPMHYQPEAAGMLVDASVRLLHQVRPAP